MRGWGPRVGAPNPNPNPDRHRNPDPDPNPNPNPNPNPSRVEERSPTSVSASPVNEPRREAGAARLVLGTLLLRVSVRVGGRVRLGLELV